MAQLPIFQNDDQVLQLMQTKWKSLLDPVLANPLMNGRLIQNIALVAGVNVIPHKLGRMMQGYIPVDRPTSSSLNRSAPLNDLTLSLNSSVPQTISLWVF